jgi:hypothetical protein
MNEQDAPGPVDRPARQPRKAYQKPQLELYGDLGELTQSMRMLLMKMKDGASHPNKHFTS